MSCTIFTYFSATPDYPIQYHNSTTGTTASSKNPQIHSETTTVTATLTSFFKNKSIFIE